MANYYTQFSVVLPYTTEAQRLWLFATFHDLAESDEGMPCTMEDIPKDSQIWLYTE